MLINILRHLRTVQLSSIGSTYDEFGSRIHLESSIGAKVVLTHNNMGQVSHLAGAQAGNKV